MANKLQDYLHYYLGCRVMAAPYGGQQKRLEKGELVGMNVRNIAHVKLDNWQSVADVSISCVKPILRRLEDITLAEITGMLKEISLLDLSDCTFEYEWEGASFYCNALKNGSVIDSIAMNDGCFEVMNNDGSFSLYNPQMKIFAILLKQNFDLFDLINADLAIDAKTAHP